MLQDPLADSLEELKRTMANMSAGAHETIPVPAPQPQERLEDIKFKSNTSTASQEHPLLINLLVSPGSLLSWLSARKVLTVLITLASLRSVVY